MPKPKLRTALEIVVALLVAQLAGAIGALFTTPQTGVGTWYAAVNKASFNPPNWVFGPVWTTLFLLMGYASYLVWTERKKKKITKPLFAYGVQLVLNIFWSVLFFGLHSPGAALVELVLLEISIIACTVLFYRVRKSAGYLMLPYAFWVAFASVLNFFVWYLN